MLPDHFVLLTSFGCWKEVRRPRVAAFAFLATHTFPLKVAPCHTFNLTTKHPFLDSRILEHRRLTLGRLDGFHKRSTCFGDEVAAFAFLATHTFPITIAACQMARQGRLDKACCFTGMFPHAVLTIKAVLLADQKVCWSRLLSGDSFLAVEERVTRAAGSGLRIRHG
jgi:hypothetical protein